jgi:hypothetical protein
MDSNVPEVPVEVVVPRDRASTPGWPPFFTTPPQKRWLARIPLDGGTGRVEQTGHLANRRCWNGVARSWTASKTCPVNDL